MYIYIYIYTHTYTQLNVHGKWVVFNDRDIILSFVIT